LERLAEAERQGDEEAFELSSQECAELFAEGTLFYFRYLHLYQLRDWDRTVRDTERNLRLFDFIHRYAEREEDRTYLEKWRPYILRMNASAAAMRELDRGAHDRALALARAAIDRLDSLEEMDEEAFKFERQRSLNALRELMSQIRRNRPASPLERLEAQLKRAIETQEFERAAVLRDQIKELRAKDAAK
jgi:excinuclease UvrABC helicase subunit UvrB